jgi:hypothetical protein
MTVITDETAGAARRRADLIAANGADGLPETLTIQLPVPLSLGHEGKHRWIERVAADWETEILPDGMGGQRVEKSFGAVRLVASVACHGISFSELKTRAAARRSSIAASGATS